MLKSFRSRDARCCVSTLVLTIALSGCGNPLPELTDIDLVQWENDKNACGTYRKDNIENLVAQKEKLLALNETQIIELIGRPDRNELYKRNQKFFYYYLKPAPECATYNTADNNRLAIRFNAMGLAKEIVIE